MTKQKGEANLPIQRQFQIIETPEFVRAAGEHLPAIQREAVYYLLIMNPFVGTENADAPGTFSLPWGGHEQFRIHYCLSSVGNEIFLYAFDAAQPASSKALTVTKSPVVVGDLAKDLRRVGIGIGLKELWDLLKELISTLR